MGTELGSLEAELFEKKREIEFLQLENSAIKTKLEKKESLYKLIDEENKEL